MNYLSRSFVRGALGAAVLASSSAWAHPYASAVTNNAGTVSFILNESANNVQVAFDNAGAGYTSTNNLGALANGLQSFALGTHTNFAIIVTKGGNGIPFQISTDTNPLVNFALPEGMAVNVNPKTANFGRIYVANSEPGTVPSFGVTRTTTQGVYLLNADQSDAVGQGSTALTAGLSVDTTASANAVPYKIAIGSDDLVYVSDCRSLMNTPIDNEAGSGIWVAAPDFSSGQDLFPFGSSTEFGGVDGTPAVRGSLATSNLVVYAYEWDYVSPTDPHVMLYNIGAGPLPWNTLPTYYADAYQGVGVNGIEGSIALSTNGLFLYTMVDRGTPGSTQSPLRIFSTANPAGSSSVWDIESAVGTTHDPFQYCYNFAISPDGTQLLTADGLSVNGPIEVFTLTNSPSGFWAPDINSYHAIDTGMDGLSDTGGNADSIRGASAIDAAGNYYAATRAGFFRVYSPGQATVAITANDKTSTNGTFSITKSSLSPESFVTSPSNLDLTGPLVAAEYYGGSYGTLYMGGVPFVNNNARISGGNASGDANTPNFGSTQDELNLATISASDGWLSPLTFSIPGTVGHSYKIQMLFHDNYTGTAAVRNRQFDVRVGTNGLANYPTNMVALAYNLDLALLSANLTTPKDVLLTYSYTNVNGTALPVNMTAEIQNPMISALIVKDTTPGVTIAPIIVASPASATKLAGQTVSFTAAVLGSAAGYQWEAGVHGSGIYTARTNGGRFSGVTSLTLTISNLTTSDQLDYVLVASNSAGSATSGVAYLTVTPLGTVGTVTSPANLGLTNGTVVLAEYYGTESGPLSVGGIEFYNNNARITGANFTGSENIPNFGATSDDTNLALISAADAWNSSLSFSVPTETGRNYRLTLLLHDNVFSTVGERVFQVNAGLQSGTLAQLGPAQIDLVELGAYETQPDDVLLTLGVTNSDASGIGVQMSSIVQNPVLSAVILQDTGAGTVPPVITIEPVSSISLYQGHTTNLFVVAGGTSLTYRWQFSLDDSTWGNLTNVAGNISGSATADLTLANITQANGGYYQVIVSNSAGSATSTAANLSVNIGPPQILSGQDLPAAQNFRVGQTISLDVGLNGDEPFACQWQNSLDGGATWSNVVNGLRITGATSNILTILNAQTNDSAIYQLSITNDQSFGSITQSAQDTINVLFGATSFDTSGGGWRLNGSGAVIANCTISLTDGAGGEDRGAFYSAPLYVGAFHANFTYQNSSGTGLGDAADGGAFVLENDPSGAAYLGGDGGSLGYVGLAGPSFALTWDLYTYDPSHIGAPGWCWSTNAANVGNSVNPFQPSGNVSVDIPDPLVFDFVYYADVLTMTMTQDGNTFTAVLTNLNLPGILGADTAYVGVTGADGADVSIQSVSNFTFTPLIPMYAEATKTNTAVLYWAPDAGLVLQSTPSLSSGSWQLVPPGNVAGQAIVPLTGPAQFYRLTAPLP